MKNQPYYLVCLLCLFLSMAKAQEQTVKGTVTSSEDASGLPGLNVIVKGTSIGFGADVTGITPDQLSSVTPDDLVRFGLIPEFVGRFPSWVALNELNKEDLIRILKDIKHNYISQYHWLFERDQVDQQKYLRPTGDQMESD